MNDRIPDIIAAIGQTSIEQLEDPAPALFLHCAVFAIGGTLSDETFQLVAFQGQESVSEPFEYQLELRANTGTGKAAKVEFKNVIGRPVSVGIAYKGSPSEASDLFQRAIRGGGVGEDMALFNGVVAAFSMEAPGVYRITMKPALWKLSLTNRYQIHSQKNVRDAIGGLLDDHRIAYSMDAVSGDDNLAVARIQDWLQAGETDFDFIRRLMSKAHLYFYFTHTGNSHRLVFVNRTGYSYPQVFSSGTPLRYVHTSEHELGATQSDVISQYSFQQSLVSSSVQSVFTRQEAAWEEDPVAQFQSYTGASRSNAGELPFRQYKIYQYGCSKDEVRHFADATGQSLETSGSQFSGSSFCAHFRVGHQFAITGAMSADDPKNLDLNGPPLQPSLDGQSFVLTQVKHQASGDGRYSNEFQATEAAGFITPFSIQETQQGAVLAKVVAKAGVTPPQDWRYYTPAYFDPETATLSDQSSVEKKLKAMGVYVRFSTDDDDTAPVWVKLSASMQTVPEIGVTVTVARAQDESELPEIQSIVQANGSMVIMPSTWTANTHVGSSYSTNYGDGQSIRFGKNSKADLAHGVGIVSTPYGTGNYRDTGYSQGASYNFSCSESNAKKTSDHAELFGPYESQGAADLLSANESFGSTYSRQYAAVTSGFSNIGISYNRSTVGKSEAWSTTTGTSYSNTTHGGKITSITTINADSSNTTTQTGDSTTTNTNNGDTTSTTTVTGTSTSTNSYGIVNNRTQTGIQANSSMTGISNSNDLTGVSSRFSATAVSTEVSAVGASVSNNNVGVSASLNNTYMSTSLSNTMVSTQISSSGTNTIMNSSAISNSVTDTGVSTSVNMIGVNNTIDLIGPGFSFSDRAIQPKVEVIDIRLTTIDILQIYL